MFRCTHGEVFYRDHNLTIDDDSELTRYRREHVGFVFQFYNLIASLTALENVELVTDIAENPMRPEEALALVGLKKDFIQGFLKKYPHYCVKLRSRHDGYRGNAPKLSDGQMARGVQLQSVTFRVWLVQ